MKKISSVKLVILLSVLLSGSLYGQETVREKCGEAYTETSKQRPIYGNSKEEIVAYFEEHVSFRSQQQFRGIFKVGMNCKGEIVQVEMITGNLSEQVLNEVQTALLKMPDWKPAELNGRVDYQFYMDFRFKEEQLLLNTIMR